MSNPEPQDVDVGVLSVLRVGDAARGVEIDVALLGEVSTLHLLHHHIQKHTYTLLFATKRVNS